MKFIIIPIPGIIDNVFPDPVERFIIADNMVVVTGLPSKIRIDFSCIDCHGRFESTDDGGQVFGLWSEFVFR